MDRIPEPDLMDEVTQARAYADADFSEPHDSFVAHFTRRFRGFSEGRVVDLGCGPGDVTIRFALAYPKSRIVGIDGAQAMLDFGQYAIEEQGLTERISLHKAVLPDEALEQQTFDAILSNSLLHHLVTPGILWRFVQRCAKPGAPVFIMDLFRPDSKSAARSLVDTYAADESPILQEDFYNSLLSAYSAEEVQEQLKRAKLSYLSIDEVSDRHILIWGTKC